MPTRIGYCTNCGCTSPVDERMLRQIHLGMPTLPEDAVMTGVTLKMLCPHCENYVGKSGILGTLEIDMGWLIADPNP